MPPKRKASKNVSSGGSDDEDYRKKRERNNQAVKRSRVKSKQKTSETKSRVDNLKMENQKLEEGIKRKRENLKMLKDMFLDTAKVKTTDSTSQINLKKILADSDDEDQEGK